MRFSLGDCTAGTLPGEPPPDQNAFSGPASTSAPPIDLPQEPVGARSVRSRSTAEEEAGIPQATAATCPATLGVPQRVLEHPPELQECHMPFPPTLTMERAIQSYLQEQREKGRSPKTVEWHQTALGLFQHYLLTEHHLMEPKAMTETMVHGWLMFLRTTPTATGTLRSLSTLATYARSVRAFCHWLVRQGYLEHSPVARGTIPRVGPTPKPSLHILEAEEFERLLLACRPPGEGGTLQEQATARNRAILWVLVETGISVRELCELRLVDVDRRHGCCSYLERGQTGPDHAFARWARSSPRLLGSAPPQGEWVGGRSCWGKSPVPLRERSAAHDQCHHALAGSAQETRRDRQQTYRRIPASPNLCRLHSASGRRTRNVPGQSPRWQHRPMSRKTQARLEAPQQRKPLTQRSVWHASGALCTCAIWEAHKSVSGSLLTWPILFVCWRW